MIHVYSAFISGIVVGFYYSKPSFFIALVCFIGLFIFKLLESRFEAFYNKENSDINKTVLSETLNNIKLIRSLNAEAAMIKKFSFEKPKSWIKTKVLFPIIAGTIFGFS